MDVRIIEADTKLQKKIRVAAYARVSTESDEQESSLENQIEYYKKLISENPDYEFAGIFYDFGVSGYKESRPGFQAMLQKAREGEIDLIITKSITRFARRTDTYLKATRELKELGIGVYFELQNINTLTQAGELLSTVYAAFAEGESKTYRELNQISYKRRFEQGIPQYQIQRMLGYNIVDGKIVIVPEEAEIIKRIFKMIKQGYRLATVAEVLTKEGKTSKNGKAITQEYVCSTIRNETYKGDYILQKTFSDDERRQRNNHGERPKYYIENDHPAIVSKTLWEAANKVLDDRIAERHVRTDDIPLTEENFPYMHKIYCAKCGCELRARKASTCVQYSFQCYGHRHFGKEFCSGVSIPQKVLDAWGDITEDLFFTDSPERKRSERYSAVTRSEWEQHHTKKTPKRKHKEYNEKNYHFYRRVFCDKCGGLLTRYTSGVGRTTFICTNNKHKSSGYCPGIRVPEDALLRLPKKSGYFLIKEEIIDGKKSYSYTCQKTKPVSKLKAD